MPSRRMNDDDTDSPDALRDQVILGRALRQLRDRAELTQDQLAERIRIDLTTAIETNDESTPRRKR